MLLLLLYMTSSSLTTSLHLLKHPSFSELPFDSFGFIMQPLNEATFSSFYDHVSRMFPGGSKFVDHYALGDPESAYYFSERNSWITLGTFTTSGVRLKDKTIILDVPESLDSPQFSLPYDSGKEIYYGFGLENPFLYVYDPFSFGAPFFPQRHLYVPIPREKQDFRKPSRSRLFSFASTALRSFIS